MTHTWNVTAAILIASLSITLADIFGSGKNPNQLNFEG